MMKLSWWTGSWMRLGWREPEVNRTTPGGKLCRCPDDCHFRPSANEKHLVDDVRQALYTSKICSYAQGMNFPQTKSEEMGWNLNLRELMRIWNGDFIIGVRLLDRIKKAYKGNQGLANLVGRGFALRQTPINTLTISSYSMLSTPALPSRGTLVQVL
ncbi:6-phosphogluconate dehydrogenase, decarboxylating 2, chloroplastic-like [Phoenix dactylifera]|uniref:phosphogluconate dehydrogenase (NADP(+)-dependent, decarboxylating) n=1 Tax=Phoenix dactylifera TaxID=42345 RepID=A0A8B9AJZ3_PHODC|nr:6-phosphogluconate dehydrogenase, decarboxylating 2, chloroplastic-like [Phoenix dactylifera]